MNILNFEQLDARTVKVLLSQKDMDDYFLEYDRMDYNDETTRNAILQILRNLQHKIPFDIVDNKFFIEAFPVKDGGCILYINIVEQGTEPLKKERVSFDTPLIFGFSDLNIVTTVCRRLLHEYIHTITLSSLYQYEQQYCLMLYTYCRMEKKITCILKEYGDFLGKGAIHAAFYREHGTEICAEQAVETIVYYLS